MGIFHIGVTFFGIQCIFKVGQFFTMNVWERNVWCLGGVLLGGWKIFLERNVPGNFIEETVDTVCSTVCLLRRIVQQRNRLQCHSPVHCGGINLLN